MGEYFVFTTTKRLTTSSVPISNRADAKLVAKDYLRMGSRKVFIVGGGKIIPFKVKK